MLRLLARVTLSSRLNVRTMVAICIWYCLVSESAGLFPAAESSIMQYQAKKKHKEREKIRAMLRMVSVKAWTGMVRRMMQHPRVALLEHTAVMQVLMTNLNWVTVLQVVKHIETSKMYTERGMSATLQLVSMDPTALNFKVTERVCIVKITAMFIRELRPCSVFHPLPGHALREELEMQMKAYRKENADMEN